MTRTGVSPIIEDKDEARFQGYGGTTTVSWRDEDEAVVNLDRQPKQRHYSSQSYSIPARSRQFAEETTPLSTATATAPQYQQGPTASPLRRRLSDPTHNQVSFEDGYNASSDRSSLFFDENGSGIFPDFHNRWLPDIFESEYQNIASSSSSLPTISNKHQHHHAHHRKLLPRSIKRRMFLFLAEPTSSKGSAIFYVVLILAIALMNIVMMMQTMNKWQYTPSDCITCGGPVVYTFEDDSIEAPLEPGVPCVCPPTPFEWTSQVLKWLIYFFTVEWTLRVLLFEPPLIEEEDDYDPRFHSHRRRRASFWRLWFAHFTDTTTILDALAIFPFYLESLENTNGLMSLRLLRLFRVFQLVRLGQYNTTFMSLTNVLWQSLLYLKLLMIVLVFGAALFGSLMYWLEKGSWQYHEESESYRFMRISVDGVTEEPSPFTSIPAAFWWFMVTATTVGYGDVYPTTTAGKWVATLAMLIGVLVVAFPVSVFSDLWSKEIQRHNIATAMHQHESHDGNKDGGAPHEDPDGGLTNDTPKMPAMPADGEASALSTRAKDVDTLWSSIGRLSFLPNDDDDEDAGGTKKMNAKEASGGEDAKDDQFEPVESGSAAGIVPMKAEDLQNIMDRLESIRENESQIRSILNKYKKKR